MPPTVYEGPSRIVVATVRTLLNTDESLNLDIFLLANGSASADQADVTLYYGPLGTSVYTAAPFTLATPGRAVFTTSLPPQVCLTKAIVYSSYHSPQKSDDFEYYIEAQLASGELLSWPPGAPDNVLFVW